MRPVPSCSVAKLALPMTRLSIMRPATVQPIASASSASWDFAPCAAWSVAAVSRRRKSFGKGFPRARSARSLARRSSMSLLISSVMARPA